jgi:hypothetical protein
MRTTSRLVGFVLLLSAAGCGGKTAAPVPARAQRDVAQRFATAVLSGHAARARALLLDSDEAALAPLVRQAAAPRRRQHASIALPPRRAGSGWLFRYAGRRAEGGGAFETQTGELVVVVASSAAGAEVRFFTFRHVTTHFSTHHDSQLLPSSR